MQKFRRLQSPVKTQLLISMPPGLREAIRRRAQASGKSSNLLINEMLNEALERKLSDEQEGRKEFEIQ